MICICSDKYGKSDLWIDDLSKAYEVQISSQDDLSSYFDNFDNSVVILDLDQFKTVEDTISFYNTIPKDINVIALLEEPKLGHGTYMIKHGFKSYIGTKTNLLLVDQAIQTVISGNVWLYPELMNFIIKQITPEQQEEIQKDIFENLSSKETQVAKLVAKGLSNKEIAQELDVQLVTVKKHVSNIFLKLEVKDRVALAIKVNQQ